MQEPYTPFLQDLYQKHLSIINNIHFTNREIDVMACLLSARGTSKIAYFLFINPRTVETHIRNIMSKLECNSRESIIDFIEASGKILFLRKYYSMLQVEALFKKSLKDILKLNQEKKLHCFFMLGQDKDPLVTPLKSHLTLAGVTVTSGARKKEEDYVIVSLPKLLIEEEVTLLFQKATRGSNKVLFLLQDKKNHPEIFKRLVNFDVVDFSKHENYYFSFFTMLQKILPTLKFDDIISNFKNKYQKTHVEPNLPKPSSKQSNSQNILSSSSTLFAFLMVGVIMSGFFAFRWTQTNNDKDIVRSDLLIPKESALLNRPELISQIDQALKKQNGIQTIALVGPGGSGKTTLAHQYAHMKKENSTIWEINAETHESLNISFEKLAQTLVKTEEDQKILKGIQGITNFAEKGDRTILFVRDRLKLRENWLLIYDNIVTFQEIQKYFPSDSETWGQGKIILTTRDGNIEANNQVNHTILIGELSPNQKLDLFKKNLVKGNEHPFTDSQTEEIKQFLEEIPPFPLDVSIAAHYLKTTNISYTAYLENLSEDNDDFEGVQGNLLKEIGGYTKTRHSIITLSLKRLMETNKDFSDLLLFISMIDSQRIPRNILNSLKNNIVVDDFILNLKKYSLITNEFPISSSSNSNFSMHRSTQAISLSYLTKELDLEKNKKLIKSITESLENYINNEVIESEDLTVMEPYVNHCLVFLKHKNLLTPAIEGIIKGELGIIYYWHGDNTKAKEFLEESLSKLEPFYEENPTRTALFLGYLGNVFRDLGNLTKGKDFLLKSITIYEASYPKEALKHAYFLVFLGIIERIIGNYATARNLFEKGLTIHKERFSENKNYEAWVSGQLGVIDSELGNDEKARNTLEKSLEIFKQETPQKLFDVAWALEYLGAVYTKLDNYEKAKEKLEECLKIYASYIPDQLGSSWILGHCEPTSKDHTNVKNLFDQILEAYKIHFHESYIYVAMPLRHLGIFYTKLGNYDKAKVILEQTLSIFQKNFGKDHLARAKTLNNLGQVYLLEGEIKNSEGLLLEAFRIFKQNNHPEIYLCLENLADLFLKKANHSLQDEGEEKAKLFKAQAILYLKQALEIVKIHFSVDSSPLMRIQEKLKNLTSI